LATPWLRIEHLIRSIVETRWDKAMRPVAKATLRAFLTPAKAHVRFRA